jgi:NAD dependent epimerase/dehydratase family enzyme
LLGGQRVLPARAERLGFQFRFATIDSALRDIF